MVKVAVAGGSQGVGSAIVAAIEARGQDEVFILSRTARQGDSRYLAVDYDRIEEIKAILKANEIHTVISALKMEDGGGEAQMNLLEAAEQSAATRRFMPSELGIDYKEKHMAALPAYEWKIKARERLEHTSLEYTLFSTGQFLDYLVAPRVPTPLTVAAPMWIDLQNNYAVIPGDGTTPVAQTHTSDVARYVAALLSLPRWEKKYYLIGDRSSIAEQVRLAEEIKGVEFEKHYEKRETLLAGERTMLPIHKETLPAGSEDFIVPILAATGVMLLDGELDLIDGEAVNVNALFPELQTKTVRDVLKLWGRATLSLSGLDDKFLARSPV
ncbi:hypothetical protein BJY04DRAFT_210682 [Aspergillus karnatakaensis]|uniref:uncharacterized protein n=1 Tax=Aspergillus karnatakaensis TaxID=1810916 RepID=UPI003CCE52FD